MKKKKLYLLLTVLVLVIFFAMALTSCKEWFGQKEPGERPAIQEQYEKDFAKAEERRQAEEAEQIAREKQVKQDEAEERALEWDVEEAAAAEEPTEEVAVAEEEEKLISNEPITYSGSIEGIEGTEVILVVNFITTEVTGSISLSGDTYVNATINGEVKINNFEITTNYSGIMGVEEDQEYPFNGTITGKITEDLSTFNGEILNDEGKGREFTLTK